MIFDLMMLSMTAVALAFVLLWWLSPALRTAIEAPKYELLASELRGSLDTRRNTDAEGGDHPSR